MAIAPSAFPVAKVHLLRREEAEIGQGGLMTAPPAGDDKGEEDGEGEAPAAAAAAVCVSSEAFLEKRGRDGEYRMVLFLPVLGLG